MRDVFKRAAITALVPGTERQLDANAWTITPPAAGATNAVRAAFPESLDQALLGALGIRAPDGSPLPGDVLAGPDGLMWQFTPRAAWPAGQYHLVAFGKTLMPLVVR